MNYEVITSLAESNKENPDMVYSYFRAIQGVNRKNCIRVLKKVRKDLLDCLEKNESVSTDVLTVFQESSLGFIECLQVLPQKRRDTHLVELNENIKKIVEGVLGVEDDNKGKRNGKKGKDKNKHMPPTSPRIRKRKEPPVATEKKTTPNPVQINETPEPPTEPTEKIHSCFDDLKKLDQIETEYIKRESKITPPEFFRVIDAISSFSPVLYKNPKRINDIVSEITKSFIQFNKNTHPFYLFDSYSQFYIIYKRFLSYNATLDKETINIFGKYICNQILRGHSVELEEIAQLLLKMSYMETEGIRESLTRIINSRDRLIRSKTDFNRAPRHLYLCALANNLTINSDLWALLEEKMTPFNSGAIQAKDEENEVMFRIINVLSQLGLYHESYIRPMTKMATHKCAFIVEIKDIIINIELERDLEETQKIIERNFRDRVIRGLGIHVVRTAFDEEGEKRLEEEIGRVLEIS